VVDAPGINTHFERFGMEIYAGIRALADKASKTEILLVTCRNAPHSTESDRQEVNINDEKFFSYHRQIYLGSVLADDCSDREDVLLRIKRAGNMFGSLRKCLFENVKIKLKIKGKVYESLILSILLYGSESWCLTEESYRWLCSFHNRCVRAMCGVSMADVFENRISNANLLNRLDIKCVDTYIVKRQLRWAGHVVRMGMDRLPRKMISSWVNEKRPRGSPEMTYGRSLFKALKKANVEKDDWFVLANDRDEWGNVCNNVP